MIKQNLVIAVAAASLLLAACQQNGSGGNQDIFSKTNVGTIAGAGLGAWAGHNVGGGSGQVIATAVGTLLGAGIGREIGGSLDRADLNQYHTTSQRAMETAQPGQSLPWNNPNSGNSGTITPSNYYRTDGGDYCREYTQTINVGGKSQQGYGTACRQPDGTWQIVE